jgi:hypothetical protein
MKKVLFIFVSIIVVAQANRHDFETEHSPQFKYSRFANELKTLDDPETSDEHETSNDAKSRPKRFIYFLCMNFPDCCDFRGKDVCGYPCPVCPKKKPPVTDGCKFLY